MNACSLYYSRIHESLYVGHINNTCSKICIPHDSLLTSIKFCDITVIQVNGSFSPKYGQWRDHFDKNLVSVFTSELLFISYNEEQGQSSVNFENIKVGKRTSSSQKTEKFIGISLMKTNEQFSYICISSSGAMFKCCVTDNKSGSNLLMSEKTI